MLYKCEVDTILLYPVIATKTDPEGGGGGGGNFPV